MIRSTVTYLNEKTFSDPSSFLSADSIPVNLNGSHSELFFILFLTAGIADTNDDLINELNKDGFHTFRLHPFYL
jgi:hypothetical protein